MRHKIAIRYFIISLLACLCLTAKANNYGLRMKSHDFSGRDKTSLTLLGGKPIELEKNVSVSFSFDVRRAPIFGNILTLIFDNGRIMELSIAPEDNKLTYSPTLIIGSSIYPLGYHMKAMHPLQHLKAQLIVDKQKNTVTFSCGNKQRTVKFDLSNASKAVFNFGRQNYAGGSMDVAPLDIYDIDVKRNGKPLYFWALDKHVNAASFDRISNAPAVAENGIWLFDCHTQWQKVFEYDSNSEVQYVFSHKQNKLFIFDDDSLITFDLASNQRTAKHIAGGYRVMRYSKYLYLNENNQTIYNYNLTRKTMTSFDLNACRWANDTYIKDEAAYLNHTQASTGGDVFYTFGGYGFYRYNNALFRLNTATGKIEQLHYSPLIEPRTTAASVVVGDKLYIFGGLGNKEGKQELPQEAYADLWEINLKTLKAQKLWSAKGKNGLALASQMIYSQSGKCFYVATSEKQILRLPLTKPNITALGDTIPVSMYFDILNYSIYESKTLGKMLVVVDRMLKDKGHVLEAFTIELPILPLDKEEQTTEGSSLWLCIVGAIIVLLVIVTIIILRRKKIAKRKQLLLEQQFAAQQAHGDTAEVTSQTGMSGNIPSGQIVSKPAKHYYDHATSEIRMLGEFQVYDKKGKDITSKFTPRTRNLMMMLFLHSATKDKGIEVRQLDEALWPNMNEEAARNNRNVYMRKLRVLLEEVGDIEITNDKINYKVSFGKGTLFDFGEANTIMDAIDEGVEDDSLLPRILELLLRGPLLPNISTEWLDDLKANYSNRALTLLHSLAHRAYNEGKLDLAYNLADAIMVHDPFSEEALAMQCRILCKRKTVGIAKILYDKFCKTYQQAMGEKYEKTFAEVCKGSE